jgi:lysozyme
MELEDLIEACQRAVGVTVDGNPGPDTWTAIYTRLLGHPPVQPPPADYTLLADGNHNDPWPPPDDMPAFIHKATEGCFFPDPDGIARRAEFKARGGKWGWYHFTSGEDPTDQANYFLRYIAQAGHQPDDLICLDFEESSRNGDSNMTPSGAEQWIQVVEAKLGCKVCVYGSDLLTGALQENADIFAGQPLWPAWYHTAAPVLPAGRNWAIWQYTSNGTPYSDMDRYAGTEAQLRAAWPNIRS